MQNPRLDERTYDGNSVDDPPPENTDNEDRPLLAPVRGTKFCQKLSDCYYVHVCTSQLVLSLMLSELQYPIK